MTIVCAVLMSSTAFSNMMLVVIFVFTSQNIYRIPENPQ